MSGTVAERTAINSTEIGELKRRLGAVETKLERLWTFMWLITGGAGVIMYVVGVMQGPVLQKIGFS